ncbi:serine/threonine protein kinase [Herbidospora galbida]|uniref:Serine/threonine protein kinase n=1 Tax=Herbidospora galbida TaxID=2575442 RepID=A0A4U3MEV7_9ACTN|nr:serine/threonine-protein kinase [Herbidospora galbida]TKK86794.1 serine/threonine protein kinase [Herbidospora galbida]
MHPYWQPPQQPASNTAVSWLWAIVPLFTCGFGTPFAIGYAAAKKRSPWLIVATGVYALNFVVFIIALASYEDVNTWPVWLDTTTTIGLCLNWFGGLAHTLIIRRGVFEPGYAWQPVQQQPVHHQQQQPQYQPQRPMPMPPPRAYPQQQPQPPRPTHVPQPHLSTPPPPRPFTQPTHPSTMGVQPRSQGPQWLGPYRVIGDLGQGGQGAVYLGVDQRGQKVAIKVLHAHIAKDRDAQARFLREVDAARRVAPFSTARVLDVNITDDLAYVVSEYVDGVSLEQLVKDKGPRTEDGLTRLALATAGALAAIHKAGIVHRDFKPSNVLIGSDGPRVIDFGIAKALDQVNATASQVMGTPAYMSPEQVGGRPVGPETDIFAWAATMVFAASGKNAFGQDTIPAILNRIINHQPDLTELPVSLRALAASCLDKDPANRPTASDIMLRIVH